MFCHVDGGCSSLLRRDRRRYDELRVLSGDRLAVEDLRRGIEEDSAGMLTMPPREQYVCEAVTQANEPDDWLFFFFDPSGAARARLTCT